MRVSSKIFQIKSQFERAILDDVQVIIDPIPCRWKTIECFQDGSECLNYGTIRVNLFTPLLVLELTDMQQHLTESLEKLTISLDKTSRQHKVQAKRLELQEKISKNPQNFTPCLSMPSYFRHEPNQAYRKPHHRGGDVCPIMRHISTQTTSSLLIGWSVSTQTDAEWSISHTHHRTAHSRTEKQSDMSATRSSRRALEIFGSSDSPASESSEDSDTETRILNLRQGLRSGKRTEPSLENNCKGKGQGKGKGNGKGFSPKKVKLQCKRAPSTSQNHSIVADEFLHCTFDVAEPSTEYSSPVLPALNNGDVRYDSLPEDSVNDSRNTSSGNQNHDYTNDAYGLKCKRNETPKEDTDFEAEVMLGTYKITNTNNTDSTDYRTNVFNNVSVDCNDRNDNDQSNDTHSYPDQIAKMDGSKDPRVIDRKPIALDTVALSMRGTAPKFNRRSIQYKGKLKSVLKIEDENPHSSLPDLFHPNTNTEIEKLKRDRDPIEKLAAKGDQLPGVSSEVFWEFDFYDLNM